MKIVFCNKYFFLNGGVEKYLYNIMNYLSARGHETIPFSIRYAGTWSSPYNDYFMAPPGHPEQAHFGNIQFSPMNIFRFIDRGIYSFEAKYKLDQLLEAAHGVDIAYILNIYNYMSPSIIHTFKRHKIPVVMQIGDYNLLCPNYSLLRNGKPCTLCVRGQYYHGLQHRCVKNSLIASTVRVTAMYIQRMLGLYRLVDAFVVPCEFMKTKLIEGGYPENKMHLLQYPVERRQGDRKKCEKEGDRRERKGEEVIIEKSYPQPYPLEDGISTDQPWQKKNYIVYFGRISYEKGLDTLICAFQKLNSSLDLYIIGRSYDGEQERLTRLIEPKMRGRIHFLEFQSGERLTRWIAEALFSVVPSRWFDNAPLSIYESYLNGTPVVASRIGGIPEQVEEGVTGQLFEPDSCEDLAKKMDLMISNIDRLHQMGIAGQDYVKRTLLIKDQMDNLIKLFESVITDYNRR